MYTELDDKKVNILGVEYDIVFMREDEPAFVEKECNGWADSTVKKICIGIYEPDAGSVADLGEFQKKVMRHEIIHAFLYESGLAESSKESGAWALNEEMVDWLAIQHSKIHAAMKQAGAL